MINSILLQTYHDYIQQMSNIYFFFLYNFAQMLCSTLKKSAETNLLPIHRCVKRMINQWQNFPSQKHIVLVASSKAEIYKEGGRCEALKTWLTVEYPISR